MRIERSLLLSWSRVDCKASRATGESPIASDRSDLMVRKIGLSGRGWRSTLEVGRSTATSTVASGAAIMKMISSTRMTSMNGVTLISWISPSVLSPWSRRMLTGLLRGRNGSRIALRTLHQIAAHHGQDLDAGVGIERAILRDRARKHVVDHHRRDRGGEPEGGGEQRLGDARRDHREIGGVQLRNPDEAVHDAPYRAEQADEGRGGADGGEDAGAAQHLPPDPGLDALEPRRDALLDAVDVAPVGRAAQFALHRRDQPRHLPARDAGRPGSFGERTRLGEHALGAGEAAPGVDEFQR